MKITWYGTASVGVETKQTKILFDPYFPMNGSKEVLDFSAFEDYQNIFVTHGHLDHISCIPDITRLSNADVYCTGTPAKTLIGKGVPDNKITVIYPGDVFCIRDCYITVFRGRHITRDAGLVAKTLFDRRLFRFRKNIGKLAVENAVYPENEETVAYLVESDGKSLFVLGSLGVNYKEMYPTDVDMLIMPYQGATNLAMPAMNIIRTLQPKLVMLDHFDDTFPPVSNEIDTSPIEDLFHGRLPIIKPEIMKEYIV